MNKITAVIFDMDGLMFDTESLFSVANAEVARKRGKEFTLEIQGKMMGQKPFHATEILRKELGIDEDPQQIFDERNGRYATLLKTDARPMLGLFQLLDLLEREGIRKAIATSSHREWVGSLLDTFDLKDRFEFVMTGDDVRMGKPNPEIYLKAVEKLALPALSCLVLEDASNGVKAGKAAGCFTVAVPNEFTKGHNFSDADLVVTSLEDPHLLECLVS